MVTADGTAACTRGLGWWDWQDQHSRVVGPGVPFVQLRDCVVPAVVQYVGVSGYICAMLWLPAVLGPFTELVLTWTSLGLSCQCLSLGWGLNHSYRWLVR